MRTVSIALLLFLGPLFAHDFTDFDLYHGLYTREEIAEKITRYLEKDPQIGMYYQLTDGAFYIGDLPNQKIEFILRLAQEKNAPFKRKNSGLAGAKIAIDPGHFGGIFAQIEQRIVKISPEETGSEDSLQVEEGTITYLTALELKNLLEAEGAQVLVTRDGISQGALKKSFFSWLSERPALWISQDSLSKIFRTYYNREDLKMRAEKINAFNPDITIIIHYNGHLGDKEKEQKTTLTDVNYNLVFIPGAFCAHELNQSEERYAFLRLLVTDSLEESLKLSRCVANQFVEKLNIPLIGENISTSYLEKMCLRQEEGIYARNLALTRMVHSPLCYGESLIQNNLEELKRLTAKDAEIDGICCAHRIKTVARAYFEGIKEYFNAR